MPSSPNDTLLKFIKERGQRQTEFGYGILTADRYVRTLQDNIGRDACCRHAVPRQTSFEDVLTKTGNILTYSSPDMEVEEKARGSLKDVDLPKNTLMVFKHVLTSSTKDRDGDILRSEGAELDPKMLLLYQHMPTLPIGKFLKVFKQSKKSVSVVSAIVDMNALSHDAATMIDNNMGRFSHGFRPLEFDKISGKDEDEQEGYDIKRFEVMEESLVSVPANPDAEQQDILLSLVEDGKLTSPLMKEYGKAIREKQPVKVPGITLEEDDERDDETKSGEGRGEDAAPEEAEEKQAEESEKEAADPQVIEEAKKVATGADSIVMIKYDLSKEKAVEGEKSGRSLSKANEARVRDVQDSIAEVLKMEDVSKAAKALLREAGIQLGMILASLGGDEDEEDKNSWSRDSVWRTPSRWC
jgi:hypothetical protein